jgi:hypothetical protein
MNLFYLSTAKMNYAHNKLYNRRGVNAHDFAKSALTFAPVTDELLSYGFEGIVYAFDFMVEVACCVCGALDNVSESGHGDSEGCYAKMDLRLMGVIELRVAAEAGQASLKWKTQALAELVKERDELDQPRFEGYFPKSIRRLQQLTGGEGVENGGESGSESESESASSQCSSAGYFWIEDQERLLSARKRERRKVCRWKECSSCLSRPKACDAISTAHANILFQPPHLTPHPRITFPLPPPSPHNAPHARLATPPPLSTDECSFGTPPCS